MLGGGNWRIGWYPVITGKVVWKSGHLECPALEVVGCGVAGHRVVGRGVVGHAFIGPAV